MLKYPFIVEISLVPQNPREAITSFINKILDDADSCNILVFFSLQVKP